MKATAPIEETSSDGNPGGRETSAAPEAPARGAGGVRMLLGGIWMDGFLDPHRCRGELHVQVRAMLKVERNGSLYFVRKPNVRMLWNYVRDIGIKATIRRIISRSSEKHRNEKYFTIGIGRVVEADAESAFAPGKWAAFCLPVGPACAQRLAVHEMLAEELDSSAVKGLSEDHIRYLDAPPAGAGLDTSRFAGWSTYSGRPLVEGDCRAFLAQAKALLLRIDWSAAQSLEAAPTPVCRASVPADPGKAPPGRKSAVLYGLGNYAKTQLMPMSREWVSIEAIHEIDPTQFPRGWEKTFRLDTRPHPAEDFRRDISFVAGYHHTHAPIAIDTLDHGGIAVVEKPLVVDRRQFAEMTAALVRHPGRLFSCFHKRYTRFNAMAREDLGVKAGAPISYHCIVYEVSLPDFHWYNWPNSGSRLLSNGCHWIDHFLFLNGFAKVKHRHVFIAPDRTVNVSVSLENGAAFSMILTDLGSSRIGVQDYIELRASGATVKLTNSDTYVSENDAGILRRMKINKMANYEAMYRSICTRIHAGGAGDSLESLEVSSGLILDLEEEFQSILRRKAD